MAVDANVLIFERIREEIRNGNTPQASIHAGYEKALSTIADANVTTLIAAVVLFGFGTGPVKGFAITLSIGIVSSMFTAIMGTRGRIVSSPLNGGGLTIQNGSNQRVEQHPPPDNFNLPLIADFVEAIKEQRSPIVSGEEGRETNIVMQRAYEQARAK